jgi:hypothetical protein
LDDALCNKLIIVTQTPPQSNKRGNDNKKIDLIEIEHSLRRYEEELWSNKIAQSVHENNWHMHSLILF